MLQALDELATERHTTSALEREVNILKQAREARTSSECRAASFENQSQDLQSKLQQAQTEREVQQAELAGARKELQKLAANLDEERRLNAVLCDQAKSLKADISVWPNQPMLRPVQAYPYGPQWYDAVCCVK